MPECDCLSRLEVRHRWQPLCREENKCFPSGPMWQSDNDIGNTNVPVYSYNIGLATYSIHCLLEPAVADNLKKKLIISVQRKVVQF